MKALDTYPETLNEFRSAADPLADSVVEQILTSGFDKEISQIFVAFSEAESINPSSFSGLSPGLAAILIEYFQTTRSLPPWVDEKRILLGSKVFSTYGPAIFMLLNISSLPLCYSCAKGAKVLYDTGRLLHQPRGIDPMSRRLMDTAQMILDVMLPGGLIEGGKGIVTIQKVRLIHAAIRYYLKEHAPTGAWDTKHYGEPINQEDMAGTLLAFSAVTLTGLKQLNTELSETEMDAYMHGWKVAGHLMGIHQSLLPDTYQEGFELAVKIIQHQAAESAEGKALTGSCIELINAMVPGKIFHDIPKYLINFFMKEYADASGVDLSKCIGVHIPAGTRDNIAMTVAKFAFGTFSRLDNKVCITKIVPTFNRLMLQGLINLFNSRKSTRFTIPPSLQRDWVVTGSKGTYKLITAK
ncbi:oxygenase MpaB family protein [Roseivirga sp. BDSF3-8]|uniref:oxygenase MpaB family protein n=1 Tax=Roseivirga sp. BDSF3-8 TaxID=3241598 RepID=UPI003531F9D6